MSSFIKYNHRPNLLRNLKTNNNKQANNDNHGNTGSWLGDRYIKYVAGLNRLLSAQPSPDLGQNKKHLINLLVSLFKFQQKIGHIQIIVCQNPYRGGYEVSSMWQQCNCHLFFIKKLLTLLFLPLFIFFCQHFYRGNCLGCLNRSYATDMVEIVQPEIFWLNKLF